MHGRVDLVHQHRVAEMRADRALPQLLVRPLQRQRLRLLRHRRLSLRPAHARKVRGHVAHPVVAHERVAGAASDRAPLSFQHRLRAGEREVSEGRTAAVGVGAARQQLGARLGKRLLLCVLGCARRRAQLLRLLLLVPPGGEDARMEVDPLLISVDVRPPCAQPDPLSSATAPRYRRVAAYTSHRHASMSTAP